MTALNADDHDVCESNKFCYFNNRSLNCLGCQNGCPDISGFCWRMSGCRFYHGYCDVDWLCSWCWWCWWCVVLLTVDWWRVQAMHNVSNACRSSAEELLQCLQRAIEQRKISFQQAGYDSSSLVVLHIPPGQIVLWGITHTGWLEKIDQT